MTEAQLLAYAQEVLGFPVTLGMPVRMDVSCTGRIADGHSRLAPRGSIGTLDGLSLRPGNAGLTVLVSIEVDDGLIVTRFDEEDAEPQFPIGMIVQETVPEPAPAPDLAPAVTATPENPGVAATQKAA
ncbi:hypothetical protein PUR29_34860 [Methylobacterium ajmalii]|uniref:Uncharacterized protein n=1 Tax=Methylobacterium ajmalii TaxID=2738439 RepID=A0ABV0A453_9HYPH